MKRASLPKLPIGIQAFEKLRTEGYADRYDPATTTLIGIAVDRCARQVGAFRVEAAG